MSQTKKLETHFLKRVALLLLLGLLTATSLRAQENTPAAGELGALGAESRALLESQWRRDAARRPRVQRRVPQTPVFDPPAGGYSYFPTSDVTCSRMLVIAGGPGTATLNDQDLDVQLVVPKTESVLEFGLFDEDTSGMWDQGSQPLRFTLYADPGADVKGTTKLLEWDGAAASDNTWSTVTYPTGPEARAPSGHYFYRLHVSCPAEGQATSFLSCFKLRVRGALALTPQSFGMIASMGTLDDMYVVYPAYPALTPTSYTGEWHFHLDVPTTMSSITVWDGDLDHGRYDATDKDTDDPNTPNDRLPPWVGSSPAQPEGVATGIWGSTGNPPDDYSYSLFVREGNITYSLVDPSGVTYDNLNPSGNLEWEQFQITGSGSFLPADQRAATPLLPAGEYDVLIHGMDLTNLNAWYFPYDTVGTDSNDHEVIPPRPYLVGDTVWMDLNGNRVQDAGEAGIVGVAVRLLDSNGQFLEATTTDAAGHYFFEVKGYSEVLGLDGPEVAVDGRYTVELDPTNLAPGGVLNGFGCTTGGTALSATVTTANVLDFDFGFQPSTSSLSGMIWHDLDADAGRDSGEPGLTGVQVLLLSSSGQAVATVVTDTDGRYRFEHLAPGLYTVQVAENSLPAGYSLLTFDVDGVQSPHTAHVIVFPASSQTGIDFGYAKPLAVGDYVWDDANANGIQDSGELPFPGVEVELYGAGPQPLQTAVTASDGRYRFEGLLPGTYHLRFDLPGGYHFSPARAGSDPARDSDAEPSGKTPDFTLPSATTDLTIDAGAYRHGSLGDTVWRDYSADGVRDAAEPGLEGVQVRLLSGGVVVASTVTDASGGYAFSELAPGTYTLAVVASSLPANLRATYDLDGITTSGSTVVALGEGQQRTDGDFGFVPANTSGALTTYTQGGWGSKPAGHNPGALLAANFSRVFPRGVRIGGGHTLTFTSAAAISRFLPQGGTPGVLAASGTDPTSSAAKVFGGQVLALQLNVSFSRTGMTRNGLGDQLLASGRLSGYSVSQVLALANRVIGGDRTALPVRVTVSDLNDVVASINEAYEEGSTLRRRRLKLTAPNSALPR